jgi:hypothetical protein
MENIVAKMENRVHTNDQVRLNLLDKCFNLGLPASSKDDINTLKMYLDVDSKLDIENFNFHVENEIKKRSGIKFFILKMFSIAKS